MTKPLKKEMPTKGGRYKRGEDGKLIPTKQPASTVVKKEVSNADQ